MSSLEPAGMLNVGDVRLEYRHWGPSPSIAPTIVLLHEGLGCLGLWGDFPARLASETGAGVFAYSRGGYGASSPVPLPRRLTYMHDEALEILPRVLAAIGFRRGILVGHSDGASIAAIYAGGVQDHRVRGLSLIAPHFFTEEIAVAEISRAKIAYESGYLKPKLARWHTNVDNAFRGWNDAWLDPEFRKWDICEYLAYIRVPVQIVQGADDQYGTLRQIEVAERECYCPVDVALLPGVRHSPHRDAPDVALGAVSNFAIRLLKDHREGELNSAA
jgi:pimeloyl-ACP methyl ester carboxylesterase